MGAFIHRFILMLFAAILTPIVFFLSSSPANAAERFDFDSKWGMLESTLVEPYLIVPSGDGNILVADGKIKKYSTDGTYLETWSVRDPDQYHLQSLAASPDGKTYALYINDSKNFVEIYASNGESAGTWDVQINKPRAIADITIDPDGNVYFVDAINRCIQKYSSDGKLLATWKNVCTGDSYTDVKLSLAAKHDGNILLGNSFTGTVKEFSPEGVLVREWGEPATETGGIHYLSDIIVSPEDAVVIVDTESRFSIIKTYSSEGVFISSWGSFGSGEGVLLRPEAAVFGADGNIYITDIMLDWVQKFTPSGDFLICFGAKSAEELTYPTAIASGSNGDLLVVNHSYFLCGILRYTLDGDYIGTLEKENKDTEYGDVAVSPSGDIFAADEMYHYIYRYSSSGDPIGKWGGSDLLGSVGVIAAAADGYVYVSDYENNRIQKFTPDGVLAGTVSDVRMYGNMAVDADGNIYIGDNNKKRIVIYGSNGQLVDTFKIQGTENRYISVSDLMVYDSNLYVLVDGKLQKYTLNGKYLEYWRLKDGVAASALAMGADGNVYVTDTNGWVCKYLHTSIEDTAVDGIALDQHQLILKLKKFTRLQATVTPRNTTEDDSVIWSSSDENIAMVDQSGKVIGKFPGSAVITATTVSGGYQDSCNVAVYPDYSFSVSPKSHIRQGDSIQLKEKVKYAKKGEYKYLFRVRPGEQDEYADISEDWSSRNTCSWSAGAPGTYVFQVKILQVSNNTIYYDGSQEITVE